MAVLRIVTDIGAPVDTCFDLSRSIDLHRESMLASGERAVAGVASGLIGDGPEVTWEARPLGRLWRMTSRITEFEPPSHFVDEMVRGPFASFRHEHRFGPHGGGTRMTDVLTFRMGPGVLGRLVDPLARAYLKRLMATRTAAIRDKAENLRPGAPGRP